MFEPQAPTDPTRAAALAAAESMGFPSRKDEAWHYSELQNFTNLPPNKAAEACDFASLDPAMINFVNGKSGETNYTVAPLAKNTTAINAYNLAYAEDGATLNINTPTTQPIILNTCGDAAAHLRHAITLAPNATATIIKTHNATAPHNIWSEIEIGEGAQLTIINLHQAGVVVDTQNIKLAKDSQLHCTDFILNGGFTRHETNINLIGAGAEAHIAAALLGCEQNHNDMRCVINHNAPHTVSSITSHNVLGDAARGIYQGKVYVAPDTQHIDAKQNIRALLLSEEAEMNAKPELEIYADDIACAHGTAIGALSADELFFLNSRGFSHAQAQEILIAAFVRTITDIIGNEDFGINRIITPHITAAVQRLTQ